MQKLVRVKLSVEEYVREQYHRQMRPPSQCPNCGRFHRLWGHAYYERGTTDSWGKAIAFWVRRFRCADCEITVSCLKRHDITSLKHQPAHPSQNAIEHHRIISHSRVCVKRVLRL